MNNILVSDYDKKSINNIINSQPDIIFSSPQGALNDLRYKEIQGILYNPTRFTAYKMHQSVAPIVDFKDAITHQVIRVATPQLNVDRAALLEKMQGADLQILVGNESLNAFFKPRGYVQRSQNKLLIKGAKSVSQDPIVAIGLDVSQKTWLQAFILLVKDFFRLLSFKILMTLILRVVL